MIVKPSSCPYIMAMEHTIRIVDAATVKPAIKLWLRNTSFSQYGDLKQLGTSFWRCSVGDQYMHQLYIIRKGTEGSLYTFIMDLEQGPEVDEQGLITGQVMAASPWNAVWDWFRTKKIAIDCSPCFPEAFDLGMWHLYFSAGERCGFCRIFLTAIH